VQNELLLKAHVKAFNNSAAEGLASVDDGFRVVLRCAADLFGAWPANCLMGQEGLGWGGEYQLGWEIRTSPIGVGTQPSTRASTDSSHHVGSDSAAPEHIHKAGALP
jgi:hypothetical protein